MLGWLRDNLEIDEKNRAALLANRAFYKWMLDFFRNLLMVAALAYVAKKSGSLLVWALAIAAGFYLCAYCYTYVEMIGVKRNILPTSTNFVRSAVVIIVLQIATAGISAGLYFAIDRIVSVQIQEAKNEMGPRAGPKRLIPDVRILPLGRPRPPKRRSQT